MPLAVATWHWVGMVAVVLTASCAAQALAVPSFDGSAAVAGLLGVLLGDTIVGRLWPELGVFLLGERAVSVRLQVRMAAIVAVAVLAVSITARDPAR